MSYGMRIPIRTRREIETMRKAGQHVGEILLELCDAAKPGVTTAELDHVATRSIQKRGLSSSFIGYGPGGLPPYPAALCVSVNDEIVHGIPSKRELKDADLVSLDFGLICNGYHGDSAVSIPVGEISDDAGQLMAATRDAMYLGIDEMLPGKRLSDIGHAIQVRAEGAGYSVVRQFVGHGIGQSLHEQPQIPNYGKPGRGPRLVAGMVFAIEPMVNIGGDEVRVLDDEWTAVTADGSLSAHFEHTVLITEGGPEILTQVPGSH